MGLKRQVIAQKVLIDPDSGEQIGRAQTRKVVRPEYVSFSKDFCKLHHVTDQFTDSQIGKLVRLSNYLDYYTNMLVDKGDGRKPIPLDYAGIGYITKLEKRQTGNYMREMLIHKAIMKIDGNYYMNPRFLSRSKSIDSDIIIKMIKKDSLIIKAMDKGTWNILKHFI